ncbi:MAG: hypothetical protein ACOX6T_26450, partial [Myxococcales bacterium]
MRNPILFLLSVLLAACSSEIPGMSCSKNEDCANGGTCNDGICVEASFVSLVLDAPKPGAIKPVFDARAHLEPRSGSSP